MDAVEGAVGSPEAQCAVGVECHVPVVVMDEMVMLPADRDEQCDVGEPVVVPFDGVVHLAVRESHRAVGDRASGVDGGEGEALFVGGGADLAAHVQWHGAPGQHDRQDVGVTCQPADRLGCDGLSVVVDVDRTVVQTVDQGVVVDDH